jgi:hypothetical protein
MAGGVLFRGTPQARGIGTGPEPLANNGNVPRLVHYQNSDDRHGPNTPGQSRASRTLCPQRQLHRAKFPTPRRLAAPISHQPLGSLSEPASSQEIGFVLAKKTERFQFTFWFEAFAVPAGAW